MSEIRYPVSAIAELEAKVSELEARLAIASQIMGRLFPMLGDSLSREEQHISHALKNLDADRQWLVQKYS